MNGCVCTTSKNVLPCFCALLFDNGFYSTPLRIVLSVQSDQIPLACITELLVENTYPHQRKTTDATKNKSTKVFGGVKKSTTSAFHMCRKHALVYRHTPSIHGIPDGHFPRVSGRHIRHVCCVLYTM